MCSKCGCYRRSCAVFFLLLLLLLLFFLFCFFASCMHFYEFIEMAAYKTHINDQRDLDMYLK